MQTVVNTLRVLEEVSVRQPVGVSELSRALELPKSSVQRALWTLNTAGWIRPAGAELTRWALTTKALHVGSHSAGELSLREAAMPIMEELRRRSEETIHLMVPDGDRVVLIERLETPKPVRIVIPLGESAPIHASSNGKAVLAYSPADDIERRIAGGLSRYTHTTITDPDIFRAELADIRSRGYATNNGEWRSDIAAVAAPVIGAGGHAIGSISISTPISRMPDDIVSCYGPMVRTAAENASKALRGDP
jgi:IclR family transcriptional regulator, acetate operon repressor